MLLFPNTIRAGDFQRKSLLQKCPALKEYAEYVARVRKHTREHPLNEGVELAVSECIREGILRDFLLQNRAEVISMSIFEYDQEAHMKHLKKEYYADGWEDGIEEGTALTLISLVRKWIRRNMPDKEIVDLTEESPAEILTLIQILKEHPDTQDREILKLWRAL